MLIRGWIVRVLGVNAVRFRVRGIFVVVFVTLIVMGAVSVQAVLFKSTGDPSYNTNAPSVTLTNSGWQYQGFWNTSTPIGNFPVGKYLGTPIAPRFFLSAKHIFGTTNNVFVFNGETYHPIAQFSTFDSDLTIWEVAETFPSYAPLYASSNESNSHIVVFGRGTQRGGPVVVSGPTNGWLWVEPPDTVLRWGENDVSSITNAGGSVGDLLRCTFDNNGGSNECDMSDGDSGGGLFIQDGGVWKLAGINYEVDGPFSNAAGGAEFNASLLDVRGLFQQVTPGNWQFMSGPQPIPSAFYSTRVSANLAWINSVVDFAPASDLQITGVQIIGSDVQISFATTNRLYFVQRSGDLASGIWTTFTNNVQGTGGIVSVLDTNAASLPKRFYRVGPM